MRRALTVAAMAALASSLAGVALATWSASGSGKAGSLARTMPTGGTPTVRVSGSDVAVTWPAVTMPGGVAVEGYVVQRQDAVSGAVATVGASCAGTVTGVTCTEQGVPAGIWTYTDTPVQASWTGGQSPPSAAQQVPGG